MWGKEEHCTSKWAHRSPHSETWLRLQRCCSSAQTKQDGRAKQQSRESVAKGSAWRQMVHPLAGRQPCEWNPGYAIQWFRSGSDSCTCITTRSILLSSALRLKNCRSDTTHPDWAGDIYQRSLGKNCSLPKNFKATAITARGWFDKVLTRGGWIQTQGTQFRLSFKWKRRKSSKSGLIFWTFRFILNMKRK